MRSIPIAESALTLFTTPDRAASITGDLVEEASTRGRLWFWFQVGQTAVSLFRRDIGTAPARMIGLAAFGMFLFAAAFVVSGLALDLVFDRWLGFENFSAVQVAWFVLSALLAPYVIAGRLARWAPGQEVTWCAAAVIAGETFNVFMLGQELISDLPRNWAWAWYVHSTMLVAGVTALVASTRQRNRARSTA